MPCRNPFRTGCRPGTSAAERHFSVKRMRPWTQESGASKGRVLERTFQGLSMILKIGRPIRAKQVVAGSPSTMFPWMFGLSPLPNGGDPPDFSRSGKVVSATESSLVGSSRFFSSSANSGSLPFAAAACARFCMSVSGSVERQIALVRSTVPVSSRAGGSAKARSS